MGPRDVRYKSAQAYELIRRARAPVRWSP